MAHTFEAGLVWTGANQTSSANYQNYTRQFEIAIDGKPVLKASAPSVFFGIDAHHNPEDLLVASLILCHALTYFGIASKAGILVTAYRDCATGTLGQDGGKMKFTAVLLRPQVTIADAARRDEALALHTKAHAACFIGNSMNFPVRNEPAVFVV